MLKILLLKILLLKILLLLLLLLLLLVVVVVVVVVVGIVRLISYLQSMTIHAVVIGWSKKKSNRVRTIDAFSLVLVLIIDYYTCIFVLLLLE